MVEVKCIVLQRRLYSGRDSLGVAANWCGCCQNVNYHGLHSRMSSGQTTNFQFILT